MELKIKIDEADIIKDVMNGLKTKEIRKNLVRNIINEISYKIVCNFKTKNVVFNKSEMKKISDDVSSIVFKDIKKKLFESHKISEEKACELFDAYITDILDGYFENTPVLIEFKIGKNKKIVDVLSKKR